MQSSICQIIITIAILLLPLSSLLAQSPTSSPLDTYFTAVRQNQRPPAPSELWQNPQQHSQTLSALSPYYSDTLPTVRAQAYYLTKQIGLRSQDPAIRQQVTRRLVKGLSDEDGSNTGRVHRYLTEFNPADFTPAARQAVASLLTQSPAHLSSLLKLIGALGMTEQVPMLQRMLPGLSARDRWTAQLALARLGEEEALSAVLARAKRYPVNDEVVYELLPDLVYNRQKAALDYLVSIMQSDEPNCTSADPEAEANIPCAYRVLELLAPIIQGFPLALDASGDLAVSDYPRALSVARRWLEEHEDYRVADGP